MTYVKLCGLRRLEDIAAANHCRPDYIGFVFAPSKRRVTADSAFRLRERLDSKIRAVGVFVNEQPGVVAELCRRGVIDLVQLHGDEDYNYIAELRALTDAPIIRSMAAAGRSLPQTLPPVEYLLFDTPSPHRGGAGISFDWSVLEGYTGLPYFLAGGLHGDNVLQAVRRLHPYAVDVSSGIETDGWKDPVKMERFVRLVRQA